jgi:peptidoglycan/xylan/chitin deacetylase (PgdA/CDA1 family)
VYLVTTPFWLRKLYGSSLMWEGPQTSEPTVYLTFDDGPHPEVTHLVLEELDRYDATATFFCIGKNVVENPGLYERVQRTIISMAGRPKQKTIWPMWHRLQK